MNQQCEGKKSYFNRKSAHRGVRKMRAVYKKPFRCYQCDECRRWHLTTGRKYQETKRYACPRKTGAFSIRGRIPAIGESVQELALKMRAGG